MNRRFLVSTVAAAALLLAAGDAPALPSAAKAAKEKPERKSVTKSFPFVGDKDVKVGLKVGEVTIESFRIRNWPDHEALEKGEKDHGDNSTMVVEFTYTNRDDGHDYKCKYTVVVPGPGDEVWAENDRDATLDKGKRDDTNKMFLKMKTFRFTKAKTIRITFDIREK